MPFLPGGIPVERPWQPHMLPLQAPFGWHRDMTLWVYFGAVIWALHVVLWQVDRSSAALSNLQAKNLRMRRALEAIAAPLECGCSPCRGDCLSDTARAIAYDEAVEIAAFALWECSSK